MSHHRTLRQALAAIVAALLVTTLAFSAIPASAAAAVPSSDGGHGWGGPRGASAGCGTAPAVAPGTSGTMTVISGGRERSALVSIPAGYTSHDRMPVVLAFHGRGSSGALIQEFTGLSDLPAITVFPEGVEVDGRQSWQGAPYEADGVDDVRFTADLLDAIEAGYCVDTRRVFATGKSNGGGLVALLSCTMNDRIAAFAPVAGAYYPQSAEGCSGADGAPVIQFHGTGDETMRYEGGNRQGADYPSVPDWLTTRAAMNGCGTATTRPFTDDSTVTKWKGCDGRDDLVHIAITGGGHTWPGARAYSGGGYTSQLVDATAVMWQFFQQHPLKRQRH